MHVKSMGQRSRGWYGRTMGAPAPPAPLLGLIFHPGALAYVVILGMLVLGFDSTGSASAHDHDESREYSCCKTHMIL